MLFKVEAVAQRQGSVSAPKTFVFHFLALCRLAEAFVITSTTVKKLQIRELFVLGAVVVISRGICDFLPLFCNEQIRFVDFSSSQA